MSLPLHIVASVLGYSAIDFDGQGAPVEMGQSGAGHTIWFFNAGNPLTPPYQDDPVTIYDDTNPGAANPPVQATLHTGQTGQVHTPLKIAGQTTTLFYKYSS